MSAVTVERACLHGKAKMEISWCALKEREAFNAFKSPRVDILKLSLEKKNSAQGPGNKPHKLCSNCLGPSAEVCSFRLNFNTSKFSNL